MVATAAKAFSNSLAVTLPSRLMSHSAKGRATAWAISSAERARSPLTSMRLNSEAAVWRMVVTMASTAWGGANSARLRIPFPSAS
ncbi:hypothetical protein D3C87_2041610 [compost metagenome]